MRVGDVMGSDTFDFPVPSMLLYFGFTGEKSLCSSVGLACWLRCTSSFTVGIDVASVFV